MINMGEKLDCNVVLHKTGEGVKVYENPTREELNTILTHLVYCNKSGKSIEGFKIEKNVKLADVSRG